MEIPVGFDVELVYPFLTFMQAVRRLQGHFLTVKVEGGIPNTASIPAVGVDLMEWVRERRVCRWTESSRILWPRVIPWDHTRDPKEIWGRMMALCTHTSLSGVRPHSLPTARLVACKRRLVLRHLSLIWVVHESDFSMVIPRYFTVLEKVRLVLPILSLG